MMHDQNLEDPQDDGEQVQHAPTFEQWMKANAVPMEDAGRAYNVWLRETATRFIGEHGNPADPTPEQSAEWTESSDPPPLYVVNPDGSFIGVFAVETEAIAPTPEQQGWLRVRVSLPGHDHDYLELSYSEPHSEVMSMLLDNATYFVAGALEQRQREAVAEAMERQRKIAEQN